MRLNTAKGLRARVVGGRLLRAPHRLGALVLALCAAAPLPARAAPPAEPQPPTVRVPPPADVLPLLRKAAEASFRTFPAEGPRGLRAAFELAWSLNTGLSAETTRARLAAHIDGDVADPVEESLTVDVHRLNAAMPPRRRMLVVVWLTGSGEGLRLHAIHERATGYDVWSFWGSVKGSEPWGMSRDLDGDGTAELLIRNNIGHFWASAHDPFAPAPPGLEACAAGTGPCPDENAPGATFSVANANVIANWTSVCRFDGQGYVFADDRFPRYYADVELPRLRRHLGALSDFQHGDREERVVWARIAALVAVAEELAGRADAPRGHTAP